jgi:hypothetical protein
MIAIWIGSALIAAVHYNLLNTYPISIMANNIIVILYNIPTTN